MNPLNQPLKGIRILDLSRLIAGPTATMILSDLGAEVIKVEPPSGDEGRRYGPTLAAGNCGMFLTYNRNKRSVVLDLSKPEGRELALRLARQSDVFVENFRLGVIERLGLGYDELRRENPGLIYCSISGYGRTGPNRHLPAFEAVLQAAGGIMSVTGEEGGGPMRVGASVGDFTAGVFAAFSILAALYARREDGQGRYLDVSLLEGQLALMNSFVVDYLLSGVIPVPLGGASQYQAPSGVYPTATEDLMIMVGEGAWAEFCRLLGVEGLTADPRFATNPLRIANRKMLDTSLHPVLRSKTAAEWLPLLRERGIPCSPINSIDQVARDPQVLARRAISEVVHPAYGPVKLVGPVGWRIWPVEQDPPMQAPPLLGEHTEEVLRVYLGLGEAELCELQERRVILRSDGAP